MVPEERIARGREGVRGKIVKDKNMKTGREGNAEGANSEGREKRKEKRKKRGRGYETLEGNGASNGGAKHKVKERKK